MASHVPHSFPISQLQPSCAIRITNLSLDSLETRYESSTRLRLAPTTSAAISRGSAWVPRLYRRPLEAQHLTRPGRTSFVCFFCLFLVVSLCLAGGALFFV